MHLSFARAMKKNRLVAGILLLQVIVATACVTSIAFLLAQRLETLAYATGLQEQGLGIIETEFVGSAAANAAAAVKADMQVLRNVARVQAVVAAESLPLSQHNLTVGFTNVPVQGQGTAGSGLAVALAQLAVWVPERRAAREAPVAVLNST